MWRLSDEQREQREHIREVVLAQIRPRLREIDESGEYPYDIHKILAAEGLLGFAIPSEYGGGGHPEVMSCALIEELAKLSGTVSLMSAYVVLTALPILIAGSEEQKEQFVTPLTSG